jgi:hypothetical protein
MEHPKPGNNKEGNAVTTRAGLHCIAGMKALFSCEKILDFDIIVFFLYLIIIVQL